MSINCITPRSINPTQIRVKSFNTYALLLLDKYPATFNLVLNDGKRTGFYVRTANTFYKVGSIQLQSNVVPISSEGLTEEEEAQILVKWSDITDRPTVTPTQIDQAVLNPNVIDSSYIKEIINIQPASQITLSAQKWYLVSQGNSGVSYQFKLPANQVNLTSIKISAIDSAIIKIAPSTGGTINASVAEVLVTDGSVEFVFSADTNDWLLVK